MKKLFLAATAMALLATPAMANTKADVGAAFSQWRTALSSGNAETIVNLYESDAILLATLAEKPITNQKDRLTYFTTLTANPKLKATVTEEHTRMLDKDTALVSGLYTFSFEQDGKTKEIPARYTFVYEVRDGQWMIVEHHSSMVPSV